MNRKQVVRMEIAIKELKRIAARMNNLRIKYKNRKIKSHHKNRSNLNNPRNNFPILSNNSHKESKHLKTTARHRELLWNKNQTKKIQNRYFSFSFQEKCLMYIRHLKQCTKLLIKKEKVLYNKKIQRKNLQTVLELKMKRNKLKYSNN